MTRSEPQTEAYDLLVLGSGEAGKYIAWNEAASGRRTALIERRYIGGSCPNIACLPSKNIIYSASVAHLAGQAAQFGLHPAEPGVEMETVRGRKRTMVDGLIKVHEGRFARTGVELIRGEGRFSGPRTIEVALDGGGVRVLTAEHVVISTGSRASIDPIPGLVESAPLTHVEALELGVVPAKLVVLGGGYVGLELAQAFRRLGSEVTIVDRNQRLLSRVDEDVAEAVTRSFLREGIELVTGARVTQVEGRTGEQVVLYLEGGQGTPRVSGTHLLVATGRIPNTQGIGLEAAGVALTAAGFVQVDECLRTTAEGVFAVGDCAGSPHFTHVAFDDHRVVRETLAGRRRVTTGRLVPSCLFVDPELAQIGLSETEARKTNTPYRLLKLPMASVLRAVTTGHTEGFLKALVGVDDDRILGFTALGSSAGEMMATVQLAMSAGLPYTALRDSIFAHPTYSEGLVYLFSAAPTRVV
ncbi:dihydrolipoyl dehydrogenase family protein [Paludibaculum fermentans]|uniref:FAD-dependent oxidoreductase n=1 Tax=Paludibaculum fermentans TaxID=1473598 RepID=A0A7S7SIZ0_PALFE|nr:FAD-dependent oxidoreductase [Paludibaculum fermentans]QOY86619.1 FAD-dependent oxidoreductase [Paludibaculum fermentans]